MEKGLEKISIVLPTYNGEKYIRESINSCLNQTYDNLELIIVDDASSSETLRIINSYSDKRIKYLRNETNLGLSEALNRGFALASGVYLTWIADDDFYSLEALAVMVAELKKNKKIDFVYANHYVVDEKGKIIRREKIASPRILNRYNCVGQCFLYRRLVYDKIGGFDPDFYLAEDYEYCLRVKSKFRLKKLNKVLGNYRLHKNSLTSQHKIAEVERQAGRANSKYVFAPSIKYYHRGKLLFYRKEYWSAQRVLLKALACGPFNLDIWKLLIFVYLTLLAPTIAKKVKKIRD